VNQQTDPRVREPAAWLIVSRLSTQQQYGEALDWAMTLSAPKNNRPGQIYQEWKESNPQEAQAWLKSANLPADRKALIEKGGSK
jgi:ferric-dicitrate binding protein FerR (iron transport regulator)